MPVYLINPLKNKQTNKQTKVGQPPHLLFPRLTRKKRIINKTRNQIVGNEFRSQHSSSSSFFFYFLLPANIGEVDWDQHRNVLI